MGRSTAGKSRRRSSAPLTWRRRATNRAFNVVVCTSCAAEPVVSTLAELRSTISRCRHGVLVRATCILGSLTCASRPTGTGAMVVLQACSNDRSPIGPALWIGPIEDGDDVRALCEFLECGDWDVDALPDRLRAHRDRVTNSRRLN